MKFQQGLVLAATVLLGVTLIDPLYPREQWLQHPPTVVSLVALFWAARRQWLSSAAMTCLVAMLVLHILGARWIYSNVPYQHWCEAAFGAGPREWFGWTRNHYDRLVHLAFGLLMPLPLAEAARRYGGLSPRWSLVLAVAAVGAASAGYEVFEWLLATIAAPDQAERYNGQQGDPWDAQKDMALAIVGSLLTAAWLAWPRRLPPTPASVPSTPRHDNRS